MFFPVILLLFWLPALLLWSPVYALARWRTAQGTTRRYAWFWAWMLPATLTVVILELIGFIGDVLGSV